MLLRYIVFYICTNGYMYTFTDLLIYKYTYGQLIQVQMYNVQMYDEQKYNVQMYNVQMYNVQMYNIQLYKCTIVKKQLSSYMFSSQPNLYAANVQMCKCTNVQM